MTHTSPVSENLGYLTVIDQPKLGLIGGYLVLNPAGRPLEFHCTTPVKPSRAQEILYGPVLEPFLYGEQIAQTLIARSKMPVRFVLTDQAAALAVQSLVGIPVLYVFSPVAATLSSTVSSAVPSSDAPELPQAPAEPEQVFEISEQFSGELKSFGIENDKLRLQSHTSDGPLQVPDVPGLDVSQWKGMRIGNRRIALPCDDKTDSEVWNQWVERITDMAKTIDLAEPFTRIHRAIEEAQRAA